MNLGWRRWLWVLAVGFQCLAAEESPYVSAGPLFHRFRLTLAPGERMEAAGPFWSVQHDWMEEPGEAVGPLEQTEVQRAATTLTLAPLFSRRRRLDVDVVDFDFVYPLVTYRRYGSEYRLQVFQWLSFSGGKQQPDEDVKRFTLFPFYFQQRSTDPSLNYTAVWPFYGRLQNRFFRDENFWVMWPLYVETRKRDVVTHNAFAPFMHWRRGDGLKGWGFWPLGGHERKLLTTQTDRFGETTLVGGWSKTFALWPLVWWYNVGIGTSQWQKQRAVLPLYYSASSPARDAQTYLWPIGLTLTQDRRRQYKEWAVLWPFVMFGRGKDLTVNRFLPFYGGIHSPDMVSTAYLWPLYRHKWYETESMERRHHSILFFLYADVTVKNKETGQAKRRSDLWPLFIARRDFEGNERFQLIAPLESFIVNNEHIERTYSPIWSLWRAEKSAKTGARSYSLLWNLWRREVAPERSKFSLLFGLFQYESSPAGKRWKLFHIPLGKRARTEPSARAGEPKDERVELSGPTRRPVKGGQRLVETAAAACGSG